MTAVLHQTVPEDYKAARESLAHRIRPAGVLDFEGPDALAFLQGQLTQEVRGLAPGEARPTAALTAKGKLLFVARLIGLPAGARLLLPASERQAAVAHLRKYVVVQRVDIRDRSEEFIRVGLCGPGAGEAAVFPEALRLPAQGEFAAELLVSAGRAEDLRRALERVGSMPLSSETAEILRVESGRPRFGADIDSNNLADEAGLETEISTTKGCYVGQEIVARLRTYGRVNRRLVGFRFPEGPVAPGSILTLPEEAEPGKIEQGRVTSSVLSPRFGAIGLGFAFRDVPVGGRLRLADPSSKTAVVTALPFAE